MSMSVTKATEFKIHVLFYLSIIANSQSELIVIFDFYIIKATRNGRRKVMQ
jgi:hypothetical protein